VWAHKAHLGHKVILAQPVQQARKVTLAQMAQMVLLGHLALKVQMGHQDHQAQQVRQEKPRVPLVTHTACL